MSGSAPALFAAAAGVALGHTIMPDHWVPLAVLGRTRRYPLRRVAHLAALAGIAHVIVSIVLGAAIIAIGLQFRSTVQHAQDLIIGWILIATGAGFAAAQLTGHGHHHHDHEHRSHGSQQHRHEHPHGHRHEHEHVAGFPGHGARGLAAVMVPFGAAASPDLTILPVFLAAASAGTATAAGSLAIFAAVTITTITGLTVAAARGGYEVHGDWLEHWGNALTALALLVIGALVLTGTI